MMLCEELWYMCPLDVAAHGQHPRLFDLKKRAAATSKETLKTMLNVVSDGVSI